MSKLHRYGLALGLVLTGIISVLPWQSAQAEDLTCASRNGQLTRCQAKIYGNVRLVDQISRAPCIEGETWGVGRNHIWVDRGCRARFVYRSEPPRHQSGRGGDRNDRLRCESTDGRQQYCRADTRNGVRLIDRLSRAPCVEGQTWGYDRRGVWVDRGCRAVFEVRNDYNQSPERPWENDRYQRDDYRR